MPGFQGISAISASRQFPACFVPQQLTADSEAFTFLGCGGQCSGETAYKVHTGIGLMFLFTTRAKGHH